MNFTERKIDRESLDIIEKEQPIENKTEITPEEQEQAREENDLKHQEEMLRERWSRFTSSIIKKDYQSDRLEDDLIWFIEKFQKTKSINHGLDAGSWTRMIFDIASDKELGREVDEWQKYEFLNFIAQASAAEERESIIADTIKQDEGFKDSPVEQNQIKERAIFLEKLLNQTAQHFSMHENRNKSQEEILVSLWSDIFARFVEMRVQASRERLKERLPEIKKRKQKTIDYLKENFPDIVSPEGLKRAKDIQIWIGDEYLESGTGWTSSGSYNADRVPSSLEISGLKSLTKEKFNKTLAHELLHAASGHGTPGELNLKQEVIGQHIIAQRRIGVSDQKFNRWLNEAITEILCGKVNNIPEDQLSYPLERTIYNLLLERQGIKEEDLMRWYFTEGDDEAEREKLQTLYPEFFRKLTLIQEMSKGGKSLERLTKEDMQSFVRAIY